MSNIGKLAVVSVVGMCCYYQFGPGWGEFPLAKIWHNPIEDANKDYVKHRTRGESEIAGKNATILQSDGIERTMTRNNP